MAKRMSARERWSKRTGKSKKEYKGTLEYKARKQIKKYYEKKKGFVRKKAKWETKKLEEDFQRILREADVAKSQTEEDWVRNMKNITENKAADLESIDYYVRTNRGRTQEDLDTSLRREARRYDLTMGRTRESLATRRVTFGGLGGVRAKEEGLVTEEHTEKKLDIETAGKRSFQDIARYEFEKNRAVEMRFGQEESLLGQKKRFALENIGLQTEKARMGKEHGIKDISLAKKESYFDLKSARRTDQAQSEAMFAEQYMRDKYQPLLWNYLQKGA